MRHIFFSGSKNFTVTIWASLMLALSLALTGTALASDQAVREPDSISMWNGNKTASRQTYEREVLEAVLTATEAVYGAWTLKEDKTDYPAAEDEASVFRKGFDIFGTVAGNQKLASEQKILVPLPLMKGLLGYRVLIIRTEDKAKFAAITKADDLQALKLGIPATWADAELFRQNGYAVVEKGSFDELFERLLKKEFDYVSFGANEVAGVFTERAASSGKLMIDNSLLVYYPFPLVFYVNPQKPALARRVTAGLQKISANGVLDGIFNRYYGKALAELNIDKRTRITLENSILPKEMSGFKSSL